MGLLDKLFGGKNKSESDSSKNINFASFDKLMDEEQFWTIIKLTKDNSGGDYERQQQELSKELSKLTPEEVILFSNRFRHFRGEANSWALWGAIYIINGGCGDDSFNDFREWVIGQGKDFYYNTVKDPETLIDKKIPDEWEGLGYVPATVFERLTGQQMPYPYKENFDTTGDPWEEDGDDLKLRFPKLSAKFNT